MAKLFATRELHTYMGLVNGTPFGYYELEQSTEEDSVQIVFCLVDEFTGRGSEAIFSVEPPVTPGTAAQNVYGYIPAARPPRRPRQL